MCEGMLARSKSSDLANHSTELWFGLVWFGLVWFGLVWLSKLRQAAANLPLIGGPKQASHRALLLAKILHTIALQNQGVI